jgi:hypothetical protein
MQQLSAALAAVGGKRTFNLDAACGHSGVCGAVFPPGRQPRRSSRMELTLRGLNWMKRAGLCLALAGLPLVACTADTTDPEAISPLGDDLKGGIPAEGQGKGKGKGRDKSDDGSAGGPASDDDAGVAEPGKGKDKDKDKDKTKKEKKPKDRDADVDESTDEPADGDEDVDVDEGADEDEGTDERAEASA